MLRKFFHRVKGQGLAEYALIISIVAFIIIVVLALLGPAIGNVYSTLIYTFQPPAAEVPEPGETIEPPGNGPPECYGSLLLPIMVGCAGAIFALANWLPRIPMWTKGLKGI